MGHTLRALWCHAQIFCQMKGLMKIHNRAKFHCHSICGSQVICSQSFSYQKKGGFMAAFGWFLVYYNPKSSLICTKFSPVMHCIASITYVTVFDIFLKISGNGAKNPIFWAFFRDFPATPSYALRVTPNSFVK